MAYPHAAMGMRYPMEEPSMFTTVLPRLQHLYNLVDHAYVTARAWVASWLRPVPLALVAGVTSDAMRSRSELVLENALLCHRMRQDARALARYRQERVDPGPLPSSTHSYWGRRASSSGLGAAAPRARFRRPGQLLGAPSPCAHAYPTRRSGPPGPFPTYRPAARKLSYTEARVKSA